MWCTYAHAILALCPANWQRQNTPCASSTPDISILTSGTIVDDHRRRVVARNTRGGADSVLQGDADREGSGAGRYGRRGPGGLCPTHSRCVESRAVTPSPELPILGEHSLSIDSDRNVALVPARD